MRFYTFILSLSLSIFNLSAQHPGLNYAFSISSNTASLLFNSFDKDSTGNIYSTGNFNGLVDLDPSASAYTLTSTNKALFIVKYNSSGQFQWATRSDGSSPSGYIASQAITTDKSGNVYITGIFSGTVDIDPTPSVLNLTCNGWDDAFIAKYNSNGVLQWAFSLGSTHQDQGKEITTDQYGNIYVSGIFLWTVDFDPSVGTATLSTTVNTSFIAKYNTNGQYQWAFTFPSPNPQVVNNLVCDMTNNLYVVGNSNGVADFDPSVSVANLTSYGNDDIFLAKYNYNGQYKWAFNLGSTGNETAYDVELDSLKNVYISGNYENTIDYDPSAATDMSSPTTSFARYSFLAKYDSLANYYWGFTLNSAIGGCTMNSIDIDKKNNIYLGGEIGGTVDFDLSTSATTLYGSNSVYAAKYDSNRQLIWALSTGTSSGGPTCINMVATDSNQVYLAIKSSSSPSFDVDPYPPAYNMQFTAIAKYACSSPSLPVNTMTNQISCGGVSATLSATSNGNINWYGGATSNFILNTGYTYITPPLNVGTYTFYAESQTCNINPVRLPITVTVVATPTTSIAGSSTMCAGTSQTLVASGATTYSWNTGATTSTISVSPPNSMTYYVTGTGANGCVSAVALSVTPVAPSVSITVTGPAYICSGTSLTLTASGANTYSWSTASTNTNITVTPTTATTYSLFGTDLNGCKNTATRYLTVAINPTVTISGSTVVCPGVPVTLIASGANVYSWTGGPNSVSITVTPTSTSIYTVEGFYAANGCSNTAIATVTVNPGPALTVSSTASVLCIGQTATLTAGGANTYSWSTAASGSVIVVSPTVNTNYVVYGAITSGCTGSLSTTQLVSACVDVNDFADHDSGFLIYPNPTNSELTITIPALNNNYSVEIYNSIGQLIKYVKPNALSNRIDLKEQSNGIYFVFISEPGAVIFRYKIIKE